MKYEIDGDIETLVRDFESGTIAREHWRHAEHLTVALYYVLHSSALSDASNKMRAGIFNLLESFGVDLEKEMSYHETLTVFWIQTIARFVESKNGATASEIRGELVERFGVDYPLKFYSRELLFSGAAREKFVAGDRRFPSE